MRSHKQLKSNTQPANLDIDSKLNGGLNLENFLLEEYKHGSAFILQIMQEITSALNLYFLLLGIFVSGLGISYQFDLIAKPSVQPH